MAAAAPRVRAHVTGFGPFGGVDANPTQAVAEALREGERSSADEEACCALASVDVLDVDARACTEWATRSVGEACVSEPDAAHVWVHLGVDSTRRTPGIALEAVAANVGMFNQPDVSGFQPRSEPVSASFGKHHALRTPLELARVARALRAAGIRAEVSEDAGRYVCNWLYYASLLACRVQADKGRSTAVFIHVPPADVQPLEETLAAVRAAIAVVCAEVEGLVSACGRYSPLHGPGSPSALVTNLVHRERALRAQTP